MISKQREKAILSALSEQKVLTTKQMVGITGVSIATVRRDLRAMEEQGLLKRTHGGARLITNAAFPNDHFLWKDLAGDPHLKEKQAVANLASTFIEDGDTIFLGAGVTSILLARNIRLMKGITVVTTNVNSILELSHSENINMILLGGDIHIGVNYIETLDATTVQKLEHMYFDKVFITVNGIHLEHGYTISYRLQLPMYKYLLENAKRFFLMANKQKFGEIAFAQLRPMESIQEVITNKDADPKYMKYYKDEGKQVYIAD